MTDDTKTNTKRSRPELTVVDGGKDFRTWPVFQTVRPLKVGIRADLISQGVPEIEAAEFLQAFTTSPQYLRACRAGTPRYDINNRVCGEVTEANQRHANMMLEKVNLELFAGVHHDT